MPIVSIIDSNELSFTKVQISCSLQKQLVNSNLINYCVKDINQFKLLTRQKLSIKNFQPIWVWCVNKDLKKINKWFELKAANKFFRSFTNVQIPIQWTVHDNWTQCQKQTNCFNRKKASISINFQKYVVLFQLAFVLIRSLHENSTLSKVFSLQTEASHPHYYLIGANCFEICLKF